MQIFKQLVLFHHHKDIGSMTFNCQQSPEIKWLIATWDNSEIAIKRWVKYPGNRIAALHNTEVILRLANYWSSLIEAYGLFQQGKLRHCTFLANVRANLSSEFQVKTKKLSLFEVKQTHFSSSSDFSEKECFNAHTSTQIYGHCGINWTLKISLLNTEVEKKT